MPIVNTQFEKILLFSTQSRKSSGCAVWSKALQGEWAKDGKIPCKDLMDGYDGILYDNITRLVIANCERSATGFRGCRSAAGRGLIRSHSITFHNEKR